MTEKPDTWQPIGAVVQRILERAAKRVTSMTAEDLSTASKMHRAGHTWRRIGAQLKIRPVDARNAVYPQRSGSPAEPPRHKKRLRTARDGVRDMVKGVSEKMLFGADHGPMPPREVLAERDARLALEPRSITAAVFGDPVAGRSALDKRRGA